MKPIHHEIQEGPDAFDRFRKAMKTIVSVPKAAVSQARTKPTKRKKAAKA